MNINVNNNDMNARIEPNNNSTYPNSNNLTQGMKEDIIKIYKDVIDKTYVTVNPFGFKEEFGAGIIVVGTMLGALSTFTITSGLIISFGTLFSIYWPEGEKDKTAWRQFMKIGEDAFQEQITKNVKEDAEAKLHGLRQVLGSYEEAFQSWRKLKEKQILGTPPSNENIQQAASLVKIRFEIAHNNLLQHMPEYQISDYKVVLLPTYAQAANLHLNLLQQGTQFADEWNKDMSHSRIKDETIAGTSDYYYQKLKLYIKDYINYCVKTYYEGLNELKSSKDITWDIYNNYRFEMTLNVLDLITLYPFYDLKKYPKGVDSELTREIYTPLDGFFQDTEPQKDENLEKIESKLTRKPGLFTWLSDLVFYTKKGTYGNEGDRLYRIDNQISYTNDVSRKSIYYGGKDLDSLIPSRIRYKDFIYKLIVTRGFQKIVIGKEYKFYNLIQHIELKTTNNTNLFYNAGTLNDKDYKKDYVLANRENNNEITNGENYSHILSQFPLYLESLNYQNYDYYVFTLGWTHYSVDRYNTINNKVCTQIPAIKAYSKGTKSEVIQGPGFTGGHIINLKDSFTIQCRVLNDTVEYQLRIIYASNGNCNVNLVIPGLSSQSKFLGPTYKNDENRDLFESYVCVEFPENIKLSSNQYTDITFNRQDNGESLLYIDKIEFLPM
ncbi:insecticidal delta-endotoxin Cry8Ea1 family protein [Cerasibacillus sp. JNUCC 74]